MGHLWTQWLINWQRFLPSLLNILDFFMVVVFTYMVLAVIGERRTLWIVRGFIILMLATTVSSWLGLKLLNFVLNQVAIGSAVAMAVILQSEFRRLLEQLGKGEILQLFQTVKEIPPEPNSVIDEIVDAVKELSQNRTGALLILETDGPIDERDFSVPGVRLNAEVSKELLQTIFQTSTLLHDGAVWIRMPKIIAAGTILPLSERTASRQLGTRHRAAMGITERVENCLGIVVSEETGSISLAQRGVLNRPLTSSKLKELLEAKFARTVERETVAPNLHSLVRQIRAQVAALVSRLLRLPPSASQKKK